MRLATTDIEATYSVTRPFRAPFHQGGLLHGLLGWGLRRAGCAEPSPCEGSCAKPGSCAWSRLFDPPPPPNPPPHRLLSSATEPPAPMIIRAPPPGAVDFKVGNTMMIGLRLVGSGRDADIGSVERALGAISELPIGEEEGRMTLDAITRRVPHEHVIEAGPAGDARVTVRFETPVRIKRGGRPAEDIDFPLLFAQVWRRLTMLCALYGVLGPEDDETFQRLRAEAAGVRTGERRLHALRWQHLSTASGERKPMSGLLGHVVFEGNLGPFLPALSAAEAVHVGGGTSFGLGRVRVERA